MIKKIVGFSISCLMIGTSIYSQVDSLNSQNLSIFNRITNDLKNYKLDTTSVPDDKITRTIMELRLLKGGFNINEAVEFKLEEDIQKKEIPESEFENFSLFFKTGNGKKWLDNSIVWIYRQHFTYQELKKLVKFYKTSAGQKIATEFPIVMMKSLAAAESIKNIYFKDKLPKN